MQACMLAGHVLEAYQGHVLVPEIRAMPHRVVYTCRFRCPELWAPKTVDILYMVYTRGYRQGAELWRKLQAG